MKTTKFTATIGVVSGYAGEAAIEAAKAYSMRDMGAAWQKAAAEVMASTGIYVSAVINTSAALYHTDWGCPVGGEPTYTISGSRNAQFCSDDEAWRNEELKVVRIVKETFKQSTVTIEYESIEQEYLA